MLGQRRSSFHRINRLDSQNKSKLTIDPNNVIPSVFEHRVSTFKQQKIRMSVIHNRQNSQLKNKLPSILKRNEGIFYGILMKIQTNKFQKIKIQDEKENSIQEPVFSHQQHQQIINKILQKKDSTIGQNCKKLKYIEQLNTKINQYKQFHPRIQQRLTNCMTLLKQKQEKHAQLMQTNRQLKQLALNLLQKKVKDKKQLQNSYLALRKQKFKKQGNYKDKFPIDSFKVKFQFHKICLKTKKQPEIFEMSCYNDQYLIHSFVRQVNTPRLMLCYLQILKLIFAILILKNRHLYQIAKLRQLVYLPIIELYKNLQQKFLAITEIQHKKKHQEQLFFQQKKFWKRQKKQLYFIYEEVKYLKFFLSKLSTQKTNMAYEIRDQIQDMVKLANSLQEQYKQLHQIQ